MRKILLISVLFITLVVITGCGSSLYYLSHYNPYYTNESYKTAENTIIENIKNGKIEWTGSQTTYGIYKHGTLFNIGIKTFKSTLLHAAVTIDNIEVVNFILSKGIDVNIRDEEGRTPLFYVKSDAMAKLLIEKGADINAKDKTGKDIIYNLLTPPSDWVIQGNKSGENYFIDKGDDRRVSIPEYLYFLLSFFEYEHGQIKYMQGRHGKVPDAYLVRLRDTVEFFKSKGFSVNIKDFNGNTPIHDIAKIYGIALGNTHAYVNIKSDEDSVKRLPKLQEIFAKILGFYSLIGVNIHEKNSQGQSYQDVLNYYINKQYKIMAAQLNKPSGFAQLANFLNQTAKLVDSGVRIYRGIQDIRGGGSSSSGGGSSSGGSSSPAGTQQGGGGATEEEIDKLSSGDLFKYFWNNPEQLAKMTPKQRAKLNGDQLAQLEGRRAHIETQKRTQRIHKEQAYGRFMLDHRIIEGPPFDEQGNYQKGEFVSNTRDFGLSVESDKRKLAIKSDIYKSYYLRNNSGKTIVIHQVYVSSTYNVKQGTYGSRSNAWYVVEYSPIILRPGQRAVVLKILPKHYGTDVSEDIRWNFGIEINKVKWSLPK